MPQVLQRQKRPTPGKVSMFAQKMLACPPDYLRTPSPPEHDTIQRVSEFRKTYYFFYGTLKDPARLSHVLDRQVPPAELLPAHIIGYSCEMWGQYQALVDGPQGGLVRGLAFEVKTEIDANKLAFYETNTYKVVPCSIYLDPSTAGQDTDTIYGVTFLYAGDPQTLREKRWDRGLWLRDMRSMFRQLGEIPP